MKLLRTGLLAASLALSVAAAHAQTTGLAPTFKEAAALYSDENYTAAYEIAVPLATKGDVNAQIMLGEMYELGRGREADMANALQWYETAAAQKHAWRHVPAWHVVPDRKNRAGEPGQGTGVAVQGRRCRSYAGQQ